MVRKSSKLISSATPLGPLRRFLWRQQGQGGNELKPRLVLSLPTAHENSALLGTHVPRWLSGLGVCFPKSCSWGHRGPQSPHHGTAGRQTRAQLLLGWRAAWACCSYVGRLRHRAIHNSPRVPLLTLSLDQRLANCSLWATSCLPATLVWLIN